MPRVLRVLTGTSAVLAASHAGVEPSTHAKMLAEKVHSLGEAHASIRVLIDLHHGDVTSVTSLMPWSFLVTL